MDLLGMVQFHDIRLLVKQEPLRFHQKDDMKKVALGTRLLLSDDMLQPTIRSLSLLFVLIVRVLPNGLNILRPPSLLILPNIY